MTEKEIVELIGKLKSADRFGEIGEEERRALEEVFRNRKSLKVFFRELLGTSDVWERVVKPTAEGVRQQIADEGLITFIYDDVEQPYDNLLAPLPQEERQRLVAESPYGNPVVDREKFAEILVDYLFSQEDSLLEPSKVWNQGIWSYAYALEDVLVELTAEGEQMRAWKYLADENPFLAAALRLGDDAKEMRTEGLNKIVNAGFFAEYLGKALTPVKVGEEEKFFLSKGTRVNGKVEDKKFILEGIVGDRTVRVSRPLTDDLMGTAAEVVREFREKAALIPEGKELAERAEKALETLPEAEVFIEENNDFSPGL